MFKNQTEEGTKIANCDYQNEFVNYSSKRERNVITLSYNTLISAIILHKLPIYLENKGSTKRTLENTLL